MFWNYDIHVMLKNARQTFVNLNMQYKSVTEHSRRCTVGIANVKKDKSEVISVNSQLSAQNVNFG